MISSDPGFSHSPIAQTGPTGWAPEQISVAVPRNLRHKKAMLSRACSAAVNGIDAYAIEVEVNCGYGDTFIAMVATKHPQTAVYVP
jgi:hypothetical protein